MKTAKTCFIFVFIALSHVLCTQEPDWAANSTSADTSQMISIFETADYSQKLGFCKSLGTREDNDFSGFIAYLFMEMKTGKKEGMEYCIMTLLDSWQNAHDTVSDRAAFFTTNEEQLEMFFRNFKTLKEPLLRAALLRCLFFPKTDYTARYLAWCGELYLVESRDSMKKFSVKELLSYVDAALISGVSGLELYVKRIYQFSPNSTVHARAYGYLITN